MIVLGLGSPYLTDDGVGPRVVRELEKSGAMTGVRFAQAHAGGLLLVEELAGAHRAVIVDALVDPERVPGTVLRAGIHGASQNLACSHDCSLAEALALGRALGLELPEDEAIHVVAIVASDVNTFSEQLSPEVEAALGEACKAVRDCLEPAVRRIP